MHQMCTGTTERLEVFCPHHSERHNWCWLVTIQFELVQLPFVLALTATDQHSIDMQPSPKYKLFGFVGPIPDVMATVEGTTTAAEGATMGVEIHSRKSGSTSSSCQKLKIQQPQNPNHDQAHVKHSSVNCGVITLSTLGSMRQNLIATSSRGPIDDLISKTVILTTTEHGISIVS